MTSLKWAVMLYVNIIYKPQRTEIIILVKKSFVALPDNCNKGIFKTIKTQKHFYKETAII